MPFAELQDVIHRTLPDARIESIRLTDCGDICLGLINADYPLGPLPPEVMQAVIRAPAYWAFCWGSGLALARYLYTHPGWVRGKRVVDLGSGSGVCAIAAARCGASNVIACDNDPDALLATAINAAANDCAVTLATSLTELSRDNDLLIMSDVLYDASNLSLLTTAKAFARQLLVADSRVTELPDLQFQQIATLEAITTPNLGEFDQYRTVQLFSLCS
jgi:predicted nicotinamide N-methyase